MGVTTLARIIGAEIPLANVAAIFAKTFGTVFGKEMVEVSPDSILQN
jgi:hypothetical protein